MVHTDTTVEAHNEETGEGVKVWNNLMFLANKVKLHLNINVTYVNVTNKRRHTILLWLWFKLLKTILFLTAKEQHTSSNLPCDLLKDSLGAKQ